MTRIRATASLIAAAVLATGLPAAAQTTTKTEVKKSTSMADGVTTNTTKVEHVTKRKTHHPRKVLGVKVGHETVTHKTVRESSVSSNGDESMKVERN